MDIHTYPEMNETIKDLLHRSEEPMNLYIVARIEELERQLEAKRFVGGPGDGDDTEIVTPTGKYDTLLPCPFCGSPRVVYERYSTPVGERWRCWCSDCIAGIDPGTAQDMGRVRDMWNRRQPEKEAQASNELET